MNQPLEILKRFWNYDGFRPMQAEIIDSILQGQDTMAILPTGAGKSICFQVPAMAKPGLCLVISPLIALMQDQVNQLKKRGIKAQAVHAGMSQKQVDLALDRAQFDPELKFLYLSPERLKTEWFLQRYQGMPISLLVVDEAHCISEWGYDFRPAYLDIIAFKSRLKNVPCLALTASATPQVREDVMQKLGLSKAKLFQQSIARNNLSYSVFWEANKFQKLLHILRAVPGTSLVYVRNRKQTEIQAQALRDAGISALAYHAGLSPEIRQQRQEDWIQGKCTCMVATNAFGMGIDKAEVRTVVHLDFPQSLEAYYQEAGRAGRDEKKAYAVLLVDEADVLSMEEQWNTRFPSPDFIKKLNQAIGNYLQLPEGSGAQERYDFDWTRFCDNFQLPKVPSHHALGILEKAGLFHLEEAGQQASTIELLVNTAQMYDFQLKNPRLEPFLKSLLRVYGGMAYQQETQIQEKVLAKQFRGSETEVHRYLQYLDQMGILRYQAHGLVPTLTWNMPRPSSQNLPVDWKQYHDLKNRAKEQWKAIWHYAKSQGTCRTQVLAAYFGEDVSEKCGICDQCLASKKAKKIPGTDATERERMRQYLANGPLTLQDLVNCLRPLNSQEALRIIEEALEAGELTYIAPGTLALI